MSSSASAVASPAVAQPWWRELTRHHWFVFAMASMAWMFDCLDQQLFILARDNAVKALSPGADALQLKDLGGMAQSIFIAGWALGGLIFGAMGDRFGRARTLALTVLLYSLCTGLSSFARSFAEFAFYRAVTGLGVGGVFGLSVALVADSLPDGARPKSLGLLQAISAVGNVTAGLCAMSLAGVDPARSWRYLFWIGSVPAFLCIFIMMRLKEPQKWQQARAAHAAGTGGAMGSYASLFGEERWRRPALLGMILCVAGVVGLWGVGFFSNSLVTPAIENAIRPEIEKAMAGQSAQAIQAKVNEGKQWWAAANLIVQNIGAFFGMILFSKAAHRFGRKPMFAIGLVCALIATWFFYKSFDSRADIWMSAVMGFFQLALFAGFAIYLPELFPTRLRSTGTSFCYNVGRFIAATGPLTLGKLQAYLGAQAVAALPAAANVAAQAAAEAEAKLSAFRSAACWLSLIYLVGLLVLPFLPETKGRPLPEDGPTTVQ